MKALETVFANLSAELLEIESVPAGEIKIHNSTELILYVDTGADNELVGVEFQLFDENMLATEDGEVFILGEEDEQYLIEDTGILKAIASFLSWRTKILKELHM